MVSEAATVLVIGCSSTYRVLAVTQARPAALAKLVRVDVEVIELQIAEPICPCLSPCQYPGPSPSPLCVNVLAVIHRAHLPTLLGNMPGIPNAAAARRPPHGLCSLHNFIRWVQGGARWWQGGLIQ